MKHNNYTINASGADPKTVQRLAEVLGKEPVPTEKSEGQALLERLLAAQDRLDNVRLRIGAVKQAVGIDHDARGENIPPKVGTTAFFPALRLIAEAIEWEASEIASQVEDLANGF